MFWKYNNIDSGRNIEELIKKEGVQLEEVLLSEDIIAQTRFNDNLLDFLLLPDNLEKLINLSLFKVDLGEEFKENESRLSYLSGEILSFENWSICEAITKTDKNLEKIWLFISTEEEELDTAKLNTFSKLICCLFSKSDKSREYFKNNPYLLTLLIKKLKYGQVQDLIQKMLQMSDTKQNEESWFPIASLIDELVIKINPEKSIEEIEASTELLIECMEFKPLNMEYSNLSFDDSRYAYIIKDLLKEGAIDKILEPISEWKGLNYQSYLINTLSLVIELLRHIPSEKYLLQTANQLVVSDYFNLLESLIKILPNLINSLVDHPYLGEPIASSIGSFKPFGLIRLKIIELISSLIRTIHQLQHTPKNSPMLDKTNNNESKLNLSTQEEPSLNLSISTISTRNNRDDSILSLNSSQLDYYKFQKKEILNKLTKAFIDEKLINIALNLFFNYPWNNILQRVIYDIIHHLLNFNIKSEFNDYQVQLLSTLFEEPSIFQRIVDAQKANDEKSAQFGGTRLGYMGYLTLITEDLLDFIQLNIPSELKSTITSQTESVSWKEYIDEVYLNLKENQEKLLGGKSIENIIHNSSLSFQQQNGSNGEEFDSVSPYKNIIDDELSDQSSDDDLHQFLSQYNNPADEDNEDGGNRIEYFDGEYGWDVPHDIQNSFDDSSDDRIPFFIHSSSSDVEMTTNLSIEDDGADLSFGESDPQDFFTDEVPLYETFAKTVIHDTKFGSFGSASTPTNSSPPNLEDEDDETPLDIREIENDLPIKKDEHEEDKETDDGSKLKEDNDDKDQVIKSEVPVETLAKNDG